VGDPRDRSSQASIPFFVEDDSVETIFCGPVIDNISNLSFFNPAKGSHLEAVFVNNHLKKIPAGAGSGNGLGPSEIGWVEKTGVILALPAPVFVIVPGENHLHGKFIHIGADPLTAGVTQAGDKIEKAIGGFMQDQDIRAGFPEKSKGLGLKPFGCHVFPERNLEMVRHAGGIDPCPSIPGQSQAFTRDHFQVEVPLPETRVFEIHVVVPRKHVDSTVRKLPQNLFKTIIRPPEKHLSLAGQLEVFFGMTAQGAIMRGFLEMVRNIIERCFFSHTVAVLSEGLLEFHETPGCCIPVEGPGYQVTCKDGDIGFCPGQEVGHTTEPMVNVGGENEAHSYFP